jgi:hypothetical protein
LIHTILLTAGENEYGDEENEYEEKKGDESSANSGIIGATDEDEAWPDDAIDTNRVPKRTTIKTKRKRNGSGNIVINIDKRNGRTANGDVNNRNAGNRRNHRNGNNVREKTLHCYKEFEVYAVKAV